MAGSLETKVAGGMSSDLGTAWRQRGWDLKVIGLKLDFMSGFHWATLRGKTKTRLVAKIEDSRRRERCLQLAPFGPIDFWLEIENEVTGWKRVGEIFFDDFEEKKTRLEIERRSLPK